MPYTARAPLHIEHQSPLDTHCFQMSNGVRFQARYDSPPLRVAVDIDGAEGHADISGLAQPDEDRAFAEACRVLARTTAVATLQVALANPNPHYGHMRVAWRPGEVTLTPRDQVPADAVGVNARTTVGADEFGDRLGRALADPELALLFASVARATGDSDFRSRFYNAFSIVEYVEARMTGDLGCAPLLSPAQLGALLEGIDRALPRDDLAEGVAGRVRARVRGSLLNATMESRAEKLRRILVERCGIQTIPMPQGETAIDRVLVQRFIDLRNQLFHARQHEGEAGLVDQAVRDTTTALVQTALKVVAHLADAEPG